MKVIQEMGVLMPFNRLVSMLAVLLVITVAAGCGSSVSKEDFEIKGNAAHITKHFDKFNAFVTLARDISQHVIEGMEVVEGNPDLRAAKIIVFTYTGELHDKYGNKSNGIWTRVVVPSAEWFKYTKETRDDWIYVQKHILPPWVIVGLPLSEGLVKEMTD